MEDLSDTFPRSRFLILKAACAHYNSRKMDEAQVLTLPHAALSCTVQQCFRISMIPLISMQQFATCTHNSYVLSAVSHCETAGVY